ncbi:MAG: glycosyltransferase family 2 protein, partial [Pseudoxanthomonas sp.]
AWDRLEAASVGKGGFRLTGRRRAPAVDPLAEAVSDRRGRAYALVATAWSGHPINDAWANRIANASGADWVLHSEPLGIYLDPDSPSPGQGMEVDWTGIWGAPMAADASGAPRPIVDCRRVSVVILYRDRVDLTIAAIASVMRQKLPGQTELVLVDNQSSELSRARLDEFLSSLTPQIPVKKVAYDDDFNHSRQCNLGAAAATGDVLIFLNNDAELISEDALDLLSRWALLPGIATVGVQMVDADGKGVGGGFRARMLPGAEVNSPVEEGSGELAGLSRITIGNTFACAAIAKAVFRDIGGLDELDFPVGFNDVEFCLRAAAAGWRHLNLASARVTHAIGASRASADEVAQKLLLRRRYPWVSVHALAEFEFQPLAGLAVHLPSMPSLPKGADKSKTKESK